jgi:hypothetical protein
MASSNRLRKTHHCQGNHSEYAANTATRTFAPGETSNTIKIVVNGDSNKEADELFCLDLFGDSSNSTHCSPRTGLGMILTMIDDRCDGLHRRVATN